MVFGSTRWIRLIFWGCWCTLALWSSLQLCTSVRTGGASDKKMIYQGQRGKIASSKIEAEWKDEKFVSSASGSLDHFLLERYRFWARRGPAKIPLRHLSDIFPMKPQGLTKFTMRGLFASQGFAEPQKNPELGHYCPGFSVEATAPEWTFFDLEIGKPKVSFIPHLLFPEKEASESSPRE